MECLDCKLLEGCPASDIDKLLTKYCCPIWQKEEEPIVNARKQIIHKFGDAGVIVLLGKKGGKSGFLGKAGPSII